MSILKLCAIAILCPVLALLLDYLKSSDKLKNVPEKVINIGIGFLFGLVSCAATIFGTEINGAILNVRDAAPLTAGLLFGGVAGIEAGIMGGIFRWVSVIWLGGYYSRLACSIATIVAGFLGALCSKFMFENKRASGIYGLFIAIVVEVLHMLILFATKVNDIEGVFNTIYNCAAPMIIINGITVGVSIWVVNSKRGKMKPCKEKHISESFSNALFTNVLIAILLGGVFTYYTHDLLNEAQNDTLLQTNLDDIEQDIQETADGKILDNAALVLSDIEDTELDIRAKSCQNPVEKNECRNELIALAEDYNVQEINIVNSNGVVILSTEKEFEGVSIVNNEDIRANEFSVLLNGESTYVQKYEATDYDPDVYRKYAGAALKNGGYVQIGYSFEQFSNLIKKQIITTAKNHHIGKNGFVFIATESNTVISSDEPDLSAKLIQEMVAENAENGEEIKITLEGLGTYYCIKDEVEGYTIATVLPSSQADFTRNASVYLTIFIQVLVFAIFFFIIYFLIRYLIVENIRSINRSLNKITEGNLDEKIEIHSNKEFTDLSNGINATVGTLKEYINEATERVDKELALASNIQNSVLPNIFPPYPNMPYFDIYALMCTAKEVGGDFYDFYFVTEMKFIILIADVSGKGIPAAMFMMNAKTLIKSLAETGAPVNEVLTKANNELCATNEADMFVTLWMGMVDLTTGTLSYVCAGHNPPLLKHVDGQFEYLKGRSGLVLAGMEGIKYKVNEIPLMPGDTLFLYTDGVTEATNPREELYGEDRLRDYLNNREDLDVENTCAGVMESISDFIEEAPQFDDITMLMFSLKELENYNKLTVLPVREEIPRVTQYIENWILRTKVDKKYVHKTDVIVDEIFSNIVNYSGATYARIEYNRDIGHLYLKFIDNGTPFNPLENEEPDITLSLEDKPIGGLGIMMVKKMSEKVEYKYDNANILSITILLPDQQK